MFRALKKYSLVRSGKDNKKERTPTQKLWATLSKKCGTDTGLFEFVTYTSKKKNLPRKREF